ncbi:MAG: phenylacetate--CoA ligase family protein [Anaerolineales bacterium]
MADLLRWTALKAHEGLTGRRVLGRLQELNRTQWLSAAELRALQRQKLQRVVAYAYQHTPYYRRLFVEVGFHPDDLAQNPDSFRKIPLLTKDLIREHFDDLMTTEPARRQQLTEVATSGSTGRPLVFMQDNDYRDAVTADIQRHLGWAGWEIGQLHAYIWGANFEVRAQESLRTRLLDWTWNRFLTNAFLLTEASLTAFTEDVRRRRPKLLFGYASSLHRFAQFVRDKGYDDITFDGIFSSAEVLLLAVRQILETTFDCRVFDRYGSKELGGLACECEAHTGLHVSVENNYIEILRDGRPAAPGEEGDVVVTNLNNLGMPFIRYHNDDIGAWYDGDAGAPCPCGRAAPRLAPVQGRIVDAFKTRDGRAAWAGFAGAGYSPLAHPNIRQFQIVQKSLDLMIVRLALIGEIPPSVTETLTQTIHTAFGDNVEVRFEFPDEIPALPSGKHQYAISEVEA